MLIHLSGKSMPLPIPPAHSCACERQHRIADRLQEVLLGVHPRESLPGVCVETVYEAALEEAAVGGDSCDAFALSNGRIALMVADASGKGLAAAERVAEVRFALRAFLREHDDPACALSCVNNFVCDTQDLGRRDYGTFVTLTLAVIDDASGEVTCLCAGGEPPLVLRDGGAAETIQVSGMALGILRNQMYSSATTRISPGEAILLVTDGLTEARRPQGPPIGHSRGLAFLGIEGVAHLADIVRGEQAQRITCPIGRAIFEGARAFAGGTFHDDACLLLGRRLAY